MNSQLIFAYIIGAGGLISAMGAWVPMVRFFRETRKETESRAVDEGLKKGDMMRMRVDIDHAHDRIRELATRMEKTQEAVIGMQSDIKHLVKAVDSILEKLP